MSSFALAFAGVLGCGDRAGAPKSLPILFKLKLTHYGSEWGSVPRAGRVGPEEELRRRLEAYFAVKPGGQAIQCEVRYEAELKGRVVQVCAPLRPGGPLLVGDRVVNYYTLIVRGEERKVPGSSNVRSLKEFFVDYANRLAVIDKVEVE